MPLSRRQFIARLAGVPGLLALPRPGTLARPLGAPSVRASLGFPDAGIQWRGDSSLSAALRAGVQVPHRERLERPARPQPFDWDAAGVVLRARFPDIVPVVITGFGTVQHAVSLERYWLPLERRLSPLHLSDGIADLVAFRPSSCPWHRLLLGRLFTRPRRGIQHDRSPATRRA